MFVPAGGHLLNTVEFGTGPDTFVAHGGWVGSWELWQQPFQLMQDRWRCIGYDHRGSGASTAPASAITPEALVDDLFTVLDSFGVERCVVAGESLGALTCVMAVLRDPSRFTGLVLVDGGARAVKMDNPLIAGSRSNFPGTVHAFVDRCIPEPNSEHLRRWGRQILLRAEPEAAARLLEAYAEADVAPDCSAIRVPTLIIHGELDAIIPLAVAATTALAIPDSKLVVIPGAGHVPTMTRPGEVVAAINDWRASQRALGTPET
jgi:pimeloyl-ACP methyl ester carboxylesterase